MTSAVLFDTNVLSELVKPRPDVRVSTFVAAQANPFISVITLHELTWGAERAPDPARRAKLIAWIAAIRARFAGRLVDVDADTSEHSGGTIETHPPNEVPPSLLAFAAQRRASSLPASRRPSSCAASSRPTRLGRGRTSR